MAAVEHSHELEQNPVDDALVREHAAGWHAFTRFMTYGIAAVAFVLIFMAIFLL